MVNAGQISRGSRDSLWIVFLHINVGCDTH